ncbi:YbgC/FadM family acyl-CoA thioesterase [Legionella septentrionalis]|uniref:YbgC/FadM family acyl-CoA thioesterase n=1 Tax=Legionella septentrionalis TaxID=2498109 RepID=A0A3S1CM04_9GAMM|nr:YbgC/FadM family acyl-CoA thioesterase [Legionella septentrionalis]RUQ89461.1 YbgC/FadM family acyl-CoA thioesterase [Legionella septentrionalis]RUQ97302.1 YbgC/FadM family acyl-CoA thioesterase [Legionella septentrionalis]RUR16094.1 YbgC/FadM family acyl-CoA thioesterase [Legionella septentrionalis]
MLLNSEHTLNLRVYAADTDFMRVVYHARFLEFFDRARTEMLREHGLSLTTMARHDTYFAIHDVHIQYFSPARLEDSLEIKTCCVLKSAAVLQFNQVMHNQSGILLSEVKVQVVCVNEALKPKRIPAEWIGGVKRG